MKVAVIGAGISGIAAAWTLHGAAEVTLYEAAGRIGGHTDTHAILTGGRTYRVDSGFIVFNEENYPGFSAFLSELGVASRASDMSFGVTNRVTGLEYGTSTLRAVFCQRRNLASPRFLRMLSDLRRFYDEALAVDAGDPRTLREYLDDGAYSTGFIEDHLGPMCAALWSLPLDGALNVPVAHVVAFMANHRMLQLNDRPGWRVVEGGSASYLNAFLRRFDGRVLTADPVRRITRQPNQVVVESASGRREFDTIVVACHSDQALALLGDPSAAERQILGAIRYQPNTAVVHSDPSVMPSRPGAWSSWNALVDDARGESCQVSYWMNRLQGLGDAQPFFVTLNPRRPLKDVWSERRYAHPVFTQEARRAQRRQGEISGVRNTFYCGAYWGWGFHEDGFASGRAAARQVLEAPAHAA